MASLVNAVSSLENLGLFDVFLPLILVFVTLFGILEKTKIITDKTVINIFVAGAAALLFTSFIQAGTFIRVLTPMIVGLLIILLFLFLLFRFMGVKEADLVEAIKENFGGYGVLVGILVICVFIAISVAFPEIQTPHLQAREPINGSTSPSVGEDTSKVFSQQMQDSLFNPTILALILMLVCFAVVAGLIVKKG